MLHLVLMTLLTASTARDTPVFAIVVTRHGVRSFTHTPAGYTWPDWAPVQPGYLTEHGYREITHLGRFYHAYFASIGLPLDCRSRATYVYADLDQRTLETARALIAGACGSPGALPMYHDAQTGPGARDPLFEGLKRPRSRKAAPPSALVAQHAADFAALQSLLDAQCNGTCPPVTSEPNPIDTGSTYAESLFLEYAQCGPAFDRRKLAGAMRVHVLEYDVNSRPPKDSHARGGNLFAHIVGLLEEKAGIAHPGVTVPNVMHDNVAFISGHDTQLGALGGILDAHWPLGNGLVADDMPPGGALIFELYRTAAGAYRVRLRFAYETLAQFRSKDALPSGIAFSPVYFAGCTGRDCSAPLARFVTLAHALEREGFVQRDWTRSSDAPIELAPPADPSWTHCN
ncbi:MAG TPA: hypothetical protein VMF11_08240 [Candidatus Baltobacteraceae bacterium]|nr:hypothetical protein [Candidatus Baltobacteraceae bacterium]